MAGEKQQVEGELVEGNVGEWTAGVGAAMTITKTCKSSHAKAFLQVTTSAGKDQFAAGTGPKQEEKARAPWKQPQGMDTEIFTLSRLTYLKLS